MRFLFFTLFCAVSLLADMSIEEAWRSLESKNSGLEASKKDYEAAKLKRESAKSMYLPSISLSANYTHLDKPIDFDTSKIAALVDAIPLSLPPFPSTMDLSKEDIFLADLQLLWPLYTGGKIDAAQEIYSAKIDESKAMLGMKKDKEFLKLIKYYYGVVLAETYYKTTQEAVKALKLHYENAKKMQQQGQIAKVELLNAQVKLDAAKIENDKAADNVSITKKALALLSGLDEDPSSKLFVYRVKKEMEYYERELVQNSATLALLDAKEKQSKSFIKVQKADFYPEVLGYGDYNLYRDDSPLMQSLPNWFAGIIVKINLLERKDRAQEISIARLQNAKVKALKKEAVDNLKILLQKSYEEMLSSLKEYKALDSSLALAKENYRLRSLSFEEGLATSSDVVDAELFLQSVETKRLNAAYNFVTKLSHLSVLSGEREKFFEIAKMADIEVLEK